MPFAHPALPPRTAFRRAHGDLESSDEVELAYAPVFARAWIAEPSLYQVTTPAFDDAGQIASKVARRVTRLAGKVRRAPARPTAAKVARHHARAARALGRACRVLDGITRP